MDDLFSYQSTGILIGLAGSFGRSIGSSSLVGGTLCIFCLQIAKVPTVVFISCFSNLKDP